jgi:pimeloyl-ACP methyl ester carboxylesterase
MRASRVKIAVEQLAQIAAPVLVVAGEKDELAGDPAPLVTAIPGARGVVLAGRNHMTAVGDKAFKQAVLDFLSTSSA